MRASILSVLLLFTVAVQAGGQLTFEISAPGFYQQQIAVIEGNMIGVKQAGGDPTIDLLFNVSQRTLFVIQHSDRSYYQFNQQSIDQINGLLDTVNSVVSAQQGVLGDLMDTLGLGDIVKQEEIRVETDALLQQFGDFNCSLVRIWRGLVLDTELCIAAADELDLSKSDYTSLQTLFEFTTQLFSKAGGLLTQLGISIPAFGALESAGLPVYVHSLKDGVKTILRGVERRLIEPGWLQLPSGYSRVAVPFIGSG